MLFSLKIIFNLYSKFIVIIIKDLKILQERYLIYNKQQYNYHKYSLKKVKGQIFQNKI